MNLFPFLASYNSLTGVNRRQNAHQARRSLSKQRRNKSKRIQCSSKSSAATDSPHKKPFTMSVNGNQLPKGSPAQAIPATAAAASAPVASATSNPVPVEDEATAQTRENAQIIELWAAVPYRRLNQAELCIDSFVRLPAVKKILRNEAGWDDFATEVINILRRRSYHLMIDHSSDCPRPRPDDPKANDWARTSRFIKS